MSISNNFHLIKSQIPEPVELVAVSKFHPVEKIKEVYDCGQKVFGENKVQELLTKVNELPADIQWHLIGHLQTNKVKQAVLNFDLIHSVDSERLAVEINKVANSLNKVQEILVQVNVVNEISKFGLNIEQVNSFIKTISQHENLKVVGLMLIAPYYENPEEARPIFRKLYEQFMEIKNQKILNVEMKWLSMGMTNDYQVAIEEGANIIRVGTGIFGQRKDV